jgi:peptidoglycan-associated lipoprotein
MSRKRCTLIILFLFCLAFVLAGCPKKTVTMDEAAMKGSDAAAARQARLEAERAKQEQELRAREEAAKMAQAEKDKEFEKSLLAKKEPGIEGEVFESSLLKDIRFDFDKYDVRPEDIDTLKQNAALLAKYPRVKIQIEGHCDERGTAQYNLALGERRSNSAKQYLMTLGISADRLATISYGEEKPVDQGHNEEAWSKNRRAHFVILSK